MQKAFLFDMDGVLINTETYWTDLEGDFLNNLLGKEINKKLGVTTGVSIQDIYKKAVALGHLGSQEEFDKAFDKEAQKIYQTVEVTPGTEKLVENLRQNGFRLGIVSASPLSWVKIFLDRVPFQDAFEVVLSLHERPDLQHKPSPDGYKEAILELNANPVSTIVLEDSNPGIQSAKAAGAYVIGLKENLVPNYVQEGADAYANKMSDVWEIILKKE